MNIHLNGEAHQCAETTKNVGDLLQELDLSEQPVVVERNGNALFPREFLSTELSEGDRIEIIRVVAGG